MKRALCAVHIGTRSLTRGSGGAGGGKGKSVVGLGGLLGSWGSTIKSLLRNRLPGHAPRFHTSKCRLACGLSRDSNRHACWLSIIGPTMELSSGLVLTHAAPLLKKEWDLCGLTVLQDRFYPC